MWYIPAQPERSVSAVFQNRRQHSGKQTCDGQQLPGTGTGKVVPACAIKTYEKAELHLHSLHYMGVNGQLQDPAALLPGKHVPVPTK